MENCSLHEVITTLERKYDHAFAGMYQSNSLSIGNFSFHRGKPGIDLKSTEQSINILKVQLISKPVLIEYLN
jgi:hypothetical protein